MKLLIASFLIAAWADAQTLEIRGKIVEGAVGLGGATVTLYEFGHTPPEATTRTVFAITSTDAGGEFQFHPARSGNYYVEVRKEGYFAESFDGPTVDPVDSTGDPVSVDQDHPVRERRFSLMRLGEVRGRVIDEDGKPMAKLSVVVQAPTSSPLRGFAGAVTDQDGYFAATKLRPGDYLVRIGPRRGLPEILPQFSEADLKLVDEDLETSYWPSVPLPVSSGASLSAGTIIARRGFYYRVHLSVSGDCARDEKWAFTVIPASNNPSFVFPRQVPCGKEFLVRNLTPGSYSFVVSSGPLGKLKEWAVAVVEVTDKNMEIGLTMSPTVDVGGRLVDTEDVTLAPPGKTMITLAPVIPEPTGVPTIAVDPAGKFLIRGLPGNRLRVEVRGLGGNFYVKEIRYDGKVAFDATITPVPGSPTPLEIVIDDKAATISGTVAERDRVPGRVMVVAVRWPLSLEGLSLLQLGVSAPANDQGRFQIGGLAPGEYRVLAVTADSLSHVQLDIVNRAEKVTLERGSSQSVSLKIVEP
jgi:hypothetical protein